MQSLVTLLCRSSTPDFRSRGSLPSHTSLAPALPSRAAILCVAMAEQARSHGQVSVPAVAVLGRGASPQRRRATGASSRDQGRVLMATARDRAKLAWPGARHCGGNTRPRRIPMATRGELVRRQRVCDGGVSARRRG